MSDALKQLLARVEGASGADREIDGELHWHFKMSATDRDHALKFRDSNWAGRRPPSLGKLAGIVTMNYYETRDPIANYSASIGAAVALVEKVLPDSDIDLEIRPGMTNGRVHQSTDATIYGHIHGPDEGKSWKAFGWTPALAICAALLRALISSDHSKGGRE